MAPRKSSEAILAELAAEDDGLYKRRIGVWSLEKLATVSLYIPAFSSACQSVGGGYYVDGLAGPGLAKVRRTLTPYFAWGSPIIALRALPKLQKCIFMEFGPVKARALRSRCTEYGDRALVREGDVNRDLAPLLQKEVPGWAPCFCLLDPEGFELHWKTLQNLARLPGRNRKPELMVLFPLNMSLIRVLSIYAPVRKADYERVDRIFPDNSWWEVYQARLRDEIDPGTAKELYLTCYADGFKKLGYRSVITKPILSYEPPGRRRRELYHLIFATDHPVGDEIMRDIFERPYILDPIVSGQQTLGI